LSAPIVDGSAKIDEPVGKATATDPGGSLAVRGGGVKLGGLGVPPAGSDGGGLKVSRLPVFDPPAPLPMLPTVTTLAWLDLAAPPTSSAHAMNEIQKGKDERRSRIGSR